MGKRLPRFKRAQTISFELTERDLAIVRLVHRHRFIRSTHVISLVGGSRQNVLRRLRLLYHHGHLERPRAQLDRHNRDGPRHMIYGLGDKGGRLMRREAGGARVPWGEKNRSAGRMFLDHALMVSDFMASLEAACRSRSVRVVHADDLGLPVKRPLQWRVKTGGASLGVIPDQAFALEFTEANGGTRRSYFFLEADRGTMPVARRGLARSSMRRKFASYAATWRQELHISILGLPHFRVLTVASSPKRLQSLIAECSRLEAGRGLFLFADKSILAGDILSNWITAKDGNAVDLLG